MKIIDLNCDMGEGCGNDSELMEYVSSVNVACGYHAGDRQTMIATAALALQKGLRIGAHPSYPDRENFGRTFMNLAAREVFDIVSDQVAAMNEVCGSIGARLSHVKPHGALYNQAAIDPALAASIAEAVKEIDASLEFYGLSGSHLISEAEKLGLRTFSEVFADRTYQPDGSLTPRAKADALIQDTEKCVEQVLQMADKGTVKAAEGSIVTIQADTVCVHGDGDHAVEFARAVKQALQENGFRIGREPER